MNGYFRRGRWAATYHCSHRTLSAKLPSGACPLHWAILHCWIPSCTLCSLLQLFPHLAILTLRATDSSSSVSTSSQPSTKAPSSPTISSWHKKSHCSETSCCCASLLAPVLKAAELWTHPWNAVEWNACFSWDPCLREIPAPSSPRGAGVPLTLQSRPAQCDHLDVGCVVGVARVGLCKAIHVQQLPVGHLPIRVEDFLSFPHRLCCNHPQTLLQVGRGEHLSCADPTAQWGLSESSGDPELLLNKHAAGLCSNEIQARLGWDPTLLCPHSQRSY